MFEAAQQILRDAGRPMHAREIHSEIVRRGLFRFGAKDPVAVLGQTLREKSDVAGDKNKAVFRRIAPNTYGLMD
jgi:hypothetical protein